MGLSQEAHTHYFPQIDIVQKSEQCNVHAIFSQRSVHYPYKSVKKNDSAFFPICLDVIDKRFVNSDSMAQ